jgi:hypothetical protein
MICFSYSFGDIRAGSGGIKRSGVSVRAMQTYRCFSEVMQFCGGQSRKLEASTSGQVRQTVEMIELRRPDRACGHGSRDNRAISIAVVVVSLFGHTGKIRALPPSAWLQ